MDCTYKEVGGGEGGWEAGGGLYHPIGLFGVELGNIPVLYRNDDILFTPVPISS